MSSISASVLAKVLQRKGFSLDGGTKHDIYRLYYQGKKTSVKVPISRGSKSSYSDYLISCVCKEMSLSKDEFFQFYECTLSLGQYIKLLITKGILKP